MSRVGKKPIPLPAGVQVEIGGGRIVVRGPQGTLEQPLLPGIRVALEGDSIVVTRQSEAQLHRQFHGLMRTLIANMVTGVTTGFSRELQIVGVGYRADMEGKDLVLHLGYSHPIRVTPPEGIRFQVGGRNDLVTVWGVDKVQVGQVAANIRALRKPEPYKGKGVRYAGEQVRRKAGKQAKTGG